MLRAYRMAGPTATAFSPPRPANIPELHYQIQRFHSFLWASGGAFSDFLIHNIDECCWIKGAAKDSRAIGRSAPRHPAAGTYRGNNIDQNFDTYSVEYTFADGAKLFLEGRTMTGCPPRVRQLRPRFARLGGDLDLGPFAGALPHLADAEPDRHGQRHLACRRVRRPIRTSSNGIT